MLERLTVEAKFRGVDPAFQLSRLERLAGGPAQRWAGHGDLAERFGAAFAAAGAIEPAMEWYQRALAAAAGTASFRAAEQLANLRCRLAAASVAGGSPDAIDRAWGSIESAVKLLEVLQSIAVTVERSRLLGRRISGWRWSKQGGTGRCRAGCPRTDARLLSACRGNGS